MGRKKRAMAPRSKPSPPPAAISSTAGGAEAVAPLEDDQTAATTTTTTLTLSSNKDDCVLASPPSVESENTSLASYTSIKLECERALNSFRRGNHTKALRSLKDLCARHDSAPNLALLYRVQGTLYVKVATLLDDPNAKQKNLKIAIESARKAVSLSPSSIEFSHFYANLLYEAADEGKEYEEVVQECERALAIENPIDPAKESLQEESKHKISTADARIEHMQNEIRSLIQKSNIASISTWMKNLGSGEEKFRLIPIRRVSEDPMELGLVQVRRPNEIKKATKTPEERRKEIEVRVAAARLMQQKSESPNSQNEDDKGLDSVSGSGTVGERRKSGQTRKNASSAERRNSVQSYWNSMSLDTKRELLKVKISDLKAHFSSSKDALVIEVLSDALPYGETNKSWKFWMCCRCGEKFAEAGAYMRHAIQEHVGSLLPKMQSVLPQNVDIEWAEALLKCSWKPLDASAAVNMLDKQSTSQSSDFLGEAYPRNEREEPKNCFADSYPSEDARHSLPAKKEPEDNCNGSTPGSREYDKISEKPPCKVCFLPDDWPEADDPERAKLLERIHTTFQALIKSKYLASRHLRKVIQFAVDELQGLAYGSQLLNYDVDKTPLCICFLGASELKKVLKFLQDLSHSCGVNRYPEKSNALEDLNCGTKGVDTIEKIIFSEDASCLMFDEHFLPCKLNPTSYSGVVADVSMAVVSSDVNKNQVMLETDGLLSWIFTGPSSAEQLASWIRIREERAEQGTEIFQILEKEFYNLQGLCELKCEHLSYEKSLDEVEGICLEEGLRREYRTESRQSYEPVLRKRRDELIESDKEITSTSNRFELDAITNVLKEAESLSVNHFGFEETYDVTSHLCDLEAGEDDDWRAKDYLHQVDSCIEVAIQRQKEQVSIELSKIDARIMRTLTVMQQLEHKLEHASAFDYRSILVSLVKSFLRAHLEDLAEKDATEKSDAAREALLAELALDSKKSGGGGSDNSRHVQEKTKDRKKNRDNRKVKDSKTTGGNELHLPPYETTEEISYTLAAEVDDETEIALDGTSDALNKQAEEYQRLNELEAEERKLEETLEYQRQIENEAKQKHLADQQHKITTQVLSEMPATVIPNDADSKEKLDNDDVNEPFKSSEKEPLIQKNAFPDINEGVSKSNSEVPAQKIALSNEGTPEEEMLPLDRRPGRRGRRQKGSTRFTDGKSQPGCSEKENIAVGQPRSVDNAHGCTSPTNNGTKTLRQLKAEEDDEARFQDDLKQAVRQSLDVYHEHQKSPLMPNSGMLHMPPEKGDSSVSSDGVKIENDNGVDVYGTGLKNEVGEYNCFLNVIIQSLWHLRRFRDEFLRRSASEHVHVGDPCVVCALYDILTALSMASTDMHREAVAPTSLRTALSNLYPDSNFFQEGQMNDASEVLGVIFDCLHRSFTSVSGVSDTEPVESNCTNSWDCTSGACIAHLHFGMDIFERMNCYDCGLESRHLKYTSFFHNINASALRTMKVMYPESSFGDLLNLVEMNHQLACDPDAGGCGKLNYIHHILSTPPHVFTIVLGWQNTCESIHDINSTLAALSTEMDIGVIYRGLDPENRHHLVSVVCYYGQHYHCFAYSHDIERWVMYDDKNVKVIGGWDDVLSLCERGHLQPQVLFFEAVN